MNYVVRDMTGVETLLLNKNISCLVVCNFAVTNFCVFDLGPSFDTSNLIPFHFDGISLTLIRYHFILAPKFSVSNKSQSNIQRSKKYVNLSLRENILNYSGRICGSTRRAKIATLLSEHDVGLRSQPA